jgi:phosphohistidine swiveling domain-containing protein
MAHGFALREAGPASAAGFAKFNLSHNKSYCIVVHPNGHGFGLVGTKGPRLRRTGAETIVPRSRDPPKVNGRADRGATDQGAYLSRASLRAGDETMESRSDAGNDETLNLVEFVDRFSDRERGRDLARLGPATASLLGRIGDEARARQVIALTYWRAWLACGDAPRILGGASEHGRPILVLRRGVGRYDLLVLDPSIPIGTPPVATLVKPAPLGVHEAAMGMFAGGLPPLAGDLASRLAREVAESDVPFSVIVAPAPQYELLAVPSQPLGISGRGTESTAGVIVNDRLNPGVVGVTAALHAVADADTVLVDGQPGIVSRRDARTDSAFIALPTVPAGPALLRTKGVMKSEAPRYNAPASFVGYQSRAHRTVITGADPTIPSPSALRQACLYTDRDAQPRDSGAALVTDDGWIVGFAFERTLPGQSPAHCSWIWAESVLDALGLDLHGGGD